MKGDPTALLKRYGLLPKDYSGRELQVDFSKPESFHSVAAEIAKSLSLPIGSTISTGTRFPEAGYFTLYACGQVAEELLDFPQDVRIHARVRTMFAVLRRTEFTESGSFAVPEQITGLLVVGLVKDASSPD